MMRRGACRWRESTQQWEDCGSVVVATSDLQTDGSYKALVELIDIPQPASTLYFMIYNDGFVDATVNVGFFRTLSSQPPSSQNPDFVSCNPTLSEIWEGTASECVDQHGGDVCAWCKVHANGVWRESCIFRDGLSCTDIWESPFTLSYCNAGFKCPASTVSLSLGLLAGAILFALMQLQNN